MNNILMLSIYVDKNGNMIFVPCKKTEAGFRRASEPYRLYEAEEIKNVDMHIKNIMDEIAINPLAEISPETPSVMKKICGKKSYKQFTKEHINIDVIYDVQEDRYIISNVPRLTDGSYGVQKNSISQQYSSKFECSGDNNIQMKINFFKACAEAQNYLYAMGELKEPNIDYNFGHKKTWIAVKDVSLNFIVDNYKIVNVEKTSWEKGLYTMENDSKKVFISGPYSGWVIIASKEFPEITNSQEVVKLLKELSGGIKEICYFSSHETVGLYGFARMFGGEVDRMYGYLGETGHVCVNMGEKSIAEQELSLSFADDDEALTSETYNDISEEDIFNIAKKWCIESMNLYETKEKSSYVGDFLGSENSQSKL